MVVIVVMRTVTILRYADSNRGIWDTIGFVVAWEYYRSNHSCGGGGIGPSIGWWSYWYCTTDPVDTRMTMWYVYHHHHPCSMVLALVVGSNDCCYQCYCHDWYDGSSGPDDSAA